MESLEYKAESPLFVYGTITISILHRIGIEYTQTRRRAYYSSARLITFPLCNIEAEMGVCEA